MVLYYSIPWYTTIVYYGIPQFTSFNLPWYTIVKRMGYHSIPCNIPLFTSFKIPWYTMAQFTLVQLYHAIPWYFFIRVCKLKDSDIRCIASQQTNNITITLANITSALPK